MYLYPQKTGGGLAFGDDCYPSNRHSCLEGGTVQAERSDGGAATRLTHVYMVSCPQAGGKTRGCCVLERVADRTQDVIRFAICCERHKAYRTLPPMSVGAMEAILCPADGHSDFDFPEPVQIVGSGRVLTPDWERPTAGGGRELVYLTGTGSLFIRRLSDAGDALELAPRDVYAPNTSHSSLYGRVGPTRLMLLEWHGWFPDVTLLTAATTPDLSTPWRAQAHQLKQERFANDPRFGGEEGVS